jgi:internalin A
LIWQEHDINEQEVFLGMMRSCGICFIHRRWVHGDEEFEEYIAPDLLPNREQIQSDLDAIWDNHLPSETIEFGYEFTHPGVIRGLMARVGSEAGITGLYWRTGFCVYEISTSSRAIIEQDMTDGWRGKILVQTQRGRAFELLQELARLVQSESSRAGARNMSETGQYRRALPLSLSVDYDDDPDRPRGSRRTLNFGQDRSEGHQYFLSYAWGDDTPEGRVRDDVVERLCAEAERRGIKILRDKSVLRLGDSISKFMSQLANGDRVFVVLSDEYLRSPYCMHELMEIWRTCAAEEQVFLDRIRVYVVPGTRIFSISERAQYAVYWRKEYEKVNNLIHNNGPDVVGRRGFQEYRLMDDFRRWVAEILETIADRLQPRSFEELAKFGLDDLAAR